MNIIKIKAGVRYAEDAVVNDLEETNESPKMPFMEVDDKYPDKFSWNIEINVDTGIILGWAEKHHGTTARTYYKVCDDLYFEYDDITYHDYVPDFLSIRAQGYGDYIYLEIDGEGHINNWDSTAFKNEIETIRRQLRKQEDM